MFDSWNTFTFIVLPLLARTGAAYPGYSHEIRSPLPETWFHKRGHPIHALFRRQAGTGLPTDGINYPQVGSPSASCHLSSCCPALTVFSCSSLIAWAAAYPASTPDADAMPQAWKDALSAAVQAGKIPNIPPSSDPNNGNPVYPPGYNPYSPQVCSGTYKCRIAGDVWDAPSGVIGISFDDGPLPVSVFHLRRHYVTRTAFARLCLGPTRPFRSCSHALSLSLLVAIRNVVSIPSSEQPKSDAFLHWGKYHQQPANLPSCIQHESR